GMHGFVENKELEVKDIAKALNEPTDERIFVISKAFRVGYTIDQIHELTKIDKWFLYKLHNILETAEKIEALLPQDADLSKSKNPAFDKYLKIAKKQGFSDFQIARAIWKEEMPEDGSERIRKYRKSLNIVPVVKQIDTLAAEYPAQANYLYLTYNGTENDVHYLGDKKSVIVLGSGAYRIGSSVEFDWCSVSALKTIKNEGYRSIMINYNPETVSTDYDMCDRLYFDELTFERVMDIVELENPHGVILSVGGQIPNNLAVRLDNFDVNILGTQANKIDNAENRHKFSSMLDDLGIDQPRWKELTSLSDIESFVDEVGYPVLVRPSYVLSGAAMNVCSNYDELKNFLQLATDISSKYPVVVSDFVENAKEIDFDAVANNGEVVTYAISEHVEFAGVHSGDATIQFPPQRLYVETARKVKKVARSIAKALEISGPFNIQFLAKENNIRVIECNLRASRSIPFVSKVLKIDFIDLATKVMLGLDVESPSKNAFDLDHVGIKASQFSFSRLQKADPVLGVDMASTGEVGCLGDTFDEALLTAMLSVGHTIPKKNVMFSTGPAMSKAELLESARMLHEKGFNLFATGGSQKFLVNNGVPATLVYWPSENKSPNTIELLQEKKIDMVVNIPKNLSASELKNGYMIRRTSIDFNIPLITNTRLARAFIRAFCTMDVDDIEIKSWDEFN
ncbi:MAG: carbamoyl-phosphate synthase large subunit, partial [Bacteroidales bacterium]|nr:carbamoyl-phosphate synthase large subunit [Bacteroidales bacterium]